MAGGYKAKGIFELHITGIDKAIKNIKSKHNKVKKAIKGELKELGPLLLADLKDETPVITGHLRDSAYFNMGSISIDNDVVIESFLGYLASYASIVELRTGMLSNVLDKWKDEFSNRVLDAGIRALNK